MSPHHSDQMSVESPTIVGEDHVTIFWVFKHTLSIVFLSLLLCCRAICFFLLLRLGLENCSSNGHILSSPFTNTPSNEHLSLPLSLRAPRLTSATRRRNSWSWKRGYFRFTKSFPNAATRYFAYFQTYSFSSSAPANSKTYFDHHVNGCPACRWCCHEHCQGRTVRASWHSSPYISPANPPFLSLTLPTFRSPQLDDMPMPYSDMIFVKTFTRPEFLGPKFNTNASKCQKFNKNTQFV